MADVCGGHLLQLGGKLLLKVAVDLGNLRDLWIGFLSSQLLHQRPVGKGRFTFGQKEVGDHVKTLKVLALDLLGHFDDKTLGFCIEVRLGIVRFLEFSHKTYG